MLWRLKADKDQVDRAISKATDSVLRRLPETPSAAAAQGALISVWKCLGCGKSNSPMKASNSDAGFAHKLTSGKTLKPDLLFGKLRSGSVVRQDSVSSIYSTSGGCADVVASPPLPPAYGSSSEASLHSRPSKLSPKRGPKSRDAGPAGFSPRVYRQLSSRSDLQPQISHDLDSSVSPGMRGSRKFSGPDGGAAGGFRMKSDH
eukprot:TRINITY_DN12335_c0_g1_i2.p1 TRINITY_DN12335_c0_g1~~TRINITY_DN12335_c0_g1_i2.p1  ORF type:complete len:203 (+),score=6.98 TRINITY_DN12335_c0_g1_i2:684-1292(+)